MSYVGLLSFALVYFVAVMSPGPGVAATVARGLGAGTRNATGYIAGFVLGDLVWFTIAATGLAALAPRFETAFLLLKYAGCVYLLWMAWKIWTTPVQTTDVAAATQVPSQWSSFLATLTLTLGNPKVMVFFLSIMPLVVDVTAMTLATYLSMAGIIVVVITAAIAVVLQLATQARRVFRSPVALTRINRASAGLMAGVAVMVGIKN
jgi:threonine/homoserine/homoserine lactone efflux protein